MALDLDKLVAEHESDPFEFTLDGTLRALPHPQELPYDVASSLDADVDFVEVVRRTTGDDGLADRLAGLPAFALDSLARGWLEHAGITAGEPQTSVTS